MTLTITKTERREVKSTKIHMHKSIANKLNHNDMCCTEELCTVLCLQFGISFGSGSLDKLLGGIVCSFGFLGEGAALPL